MIVGYVRVSVKENDSDSIINQINLIKSYCLDNNYKLDHIYIDNGISGVTFERDAFLELKRDILNKMIKIVIVKDLSRFGRNSFETSYYINDFLSLNNVKLISLDGINEDILINMKSIMNEYNVKESSLKRKNIAYLKTLNHEFIGPYAPYGYKIKYVNNKRTLTILEEEGYIVKLIFKKRLEGLSFFDIALFLNDNILYSSNSKSLNVRQHIWNSLSVRRIIENVVYKGDMVVRKTVKNNYLDKNRKYVSKSDYEVIPNVYPALINESDFLKANSYTKRYSLHKMKIDENLLSKLVYCSKCKRIMRYYQRYKNSTYQIYFKCLSCNKTIFLSKLMKIIEKEKHELLSDIDKDLIIKRVIHKIVLYIVSLKTDFKQSKEVLLKKNVELYRKRERKLIIDDNFKTNYEKNVNLIDKFDRMERTLDLLNINEYIYDYHFDIDIHALIKKIEISDYIRIFLHIKKA